MHKKILLSLGLLAELSTYGDHLVKPNLINTQQVNLHQEMIADNIGSNKEFTHTCINDKSHEEYSAFEHIAAMGVSIHYAPRHGRSLYSMYHYGPLYSKKPRRPVYCRYHYPTDSDINAEGLHRCVYSTWYYDIHAKEWIKTDLNANSEGFHDIHAKEIAEADSDTNCFSRYDIYADEWIETER